MSNLKFQPFDWDGPRKVQTPNIEDDIKKYLGEDLLEKWTITTDIELKQKIIIVAERLDFISHLKSIAMIEKRNQRELRKK